MAHQTKEYQKTTKHGQCWPTKNTHTAGYSASPNVK